MMIRAETPNFNEIKMIAGRPVCAAIVVKAIAHLARLVNLDEERNLQEIQIKEIVNDIIDEYGHLKPEEIKYIFKRALRTQKLFARLDYNIVMGWIEEYDKERIEYCMDISDHEDKQRGNDTADDTSAISFDEFLASLRAKSSQGDTEACELLKTADMLLSGAKMLTAEEQRQKKVDFFMWYHQVFMNNDKNKNNRTE